MIPNEEDIREYARYAAKVREVVREELLEQTGKPVSPTVLRELARFATMPIGIWMNNRVSILQLKENSLQILGDLEQREKLDSLIAEYNLIQSNGYLKPAIILNREAFQTLRNAMWSIGYIYEIGAGFVEELSH